MSSITIGFQGLKMKMLDNIKLEKDMIKHSSECVSYKMTKEEIDKYFDNKNYKK